jgi:hypothetical protein
VRNHTRHESSGTFMRKLVHRDWDDTNSPLFEYGYVFGIRITDFADMDGIDSSFTQQDCCRSWQPLIKQQFHGWR